MSELEREPVRGCHSDPWEGKSVGGTARGGGRPAPSPEEPRHVEGDRHAASAGHDPEEEEQQEVR